MTSPTPPPTHPPTKILLLGAGELGLALLSSLTSRPTAFPSTHITVGVRSPQNYTHLEAPNIALAQIDTTSPSHTLIPIFSQFDVLISATGFTSTPHSVTKLAEEVLKAGQLRQERGKGRIWYFPWQWGADYDVTGDVDGLMPLFGQQKYVRDLLREKAQCSGVKWTVVSMGMFMSFLFSAFWMVVGRSGEKGEGGKAGTVVRCLGDWEHRVSVTDVDDIGRVLRRVLDGDVESENRVLYVAGDTISYGELADVVESVVGCEVQREQWSVQDMEEELRKDPDDGIKKYRLVFAGEGVWWEKERTVNYELGMSMVDVETYARKIFGTQK